VLGRRVAITSFDFFLISLIAEAFRYFRCSSWSRAGHEFSFELILVSESVQFGTILRCVSFSVILSVTIELALRVL
jgi:hypothetical protein